MPKTKENEKELVKLTEDKRKLKEYKASMTKKYIIGIDPGTQGAYCILFEGKILKCEKLPTTQILGETWIDRESLAFSIADITNYATKGLEFIIERPWVSGKEQGAEKIWGNFMLLKLVVDNLFGDASFVRPLEWQKGLGIATNRVESKNLTAKERKERTKQNSIDFAVKNNPKQDFYRRTNVKKNVTGDVDNNLTDAFCIAYYGYLLNQSL